MKKLHSFQKVALLLLTLAGTTSMQGQGTLDMGILYNKPLMDLQSGGFKEGIGIYLGGWSPDLLKGKGPALQLGGRTDFSWNGNRHQDLTLMPGNVSARMNVNNYTFGIQGGARLIAPNTVRLRPYLDGYAGFRLIGTNETLNLTNTWNNDDDNTLTSSWPAKATSFSYGGAVGAQYWLNSCVALDLRGVLLDGPRAKYGNLNTVLFENGVPSYTVNTSRATMMYLQLGITVSLSKKCDCGDGSSSGSSGSTYYGPQRSYSPRGSIQRQGGSMRPSTGGAPRSSSPARVAPSIRPGIPRS